LDLCAADRDRARCFEPKRSTGVRQHLLPLRLERLTRADLERVAVHDEGRLRLDLDVTGALDRDDLVDRIEDDLVLLRLVDDRDAFGTVFVVEDDAVTGARLDQLRVVLAALVDLDRLLFLRPQRADHDRLVDVAVLEHDEHLVVDFGEKVGAALFAGHRDRDPRPVRLLLLVHPRVLDPDPIARIAVALGVLDDKREMHATDLRCAQRLWHHAIDREQRHAMSTFDPS
jgi:hypothetical protein